MKPNTHEMHGQECIESESMLPHGPRVCTDCGHLIHERMTTGPCLAGRASDPKEVIDMA